MCILIKILIQESFCFWCISYLCGWFSGYKNAYPNPYFQKKADETSCNVKKLYMVLLTCPVFPSLQGKPFELWNIFIVIFTAKTTASSTLFPQILWNFGIPDVVLAKDRHILCISIMYAICMCAWHAISCRIIIYTLCCITNHYYHDVYNHQDPYTSC